MATKKKTTTKATAEKPGVDKVAVLEKKIADLTARVTDLEDHRVKLDIDSFEPAKEQAKQWIRDEPLKAVVLAVLITALIFLLFG